MARILFAAALGAALATAVAPVLPAQAVEPAQGTRLGTELNEISTALGVSGYDLTRYEREDGEIALTAIKERRRLEIYLDPRTGEVSRIEERTRRGPWPLPGTSDAETRAQLEAEGYRILGYEREHGRIDAKLERGGRRYEIEIDPQGGRTARIEEDD